MHDICVTDEAIRFEQSRFLEYSFKSNCELQLLSRPLIIDLKKVGIFMIESKCLGDKS